MTNKKNEVVDLAELLLKRQAELSGILDITRAINNNAPALQLMEMLVMILKNILKIGKFRLLVQVENRFSCVCKFGGQIESFQHFQQVAKILGDIKTQIPLNNHSNALLNNYQYFIPVYHKNNRIAYALIGGLDTSQPFVSNAIDYIQTLVNIIMVALENKKLFKERLLKERLQREMELAQQVQTMLIPQNLPHNSYLHAEATYLPHQNIGGDFFDFITLSANESIWCIADVSGKGISAALLMANFQASLRALAPVEQDLSILVQKLNSIVFANTNGDNFVTLFLGKYNSNTRVLNYINAGHNASLIYQNGGITALKSGCIMIGALNELPFINQGEITLSKNALVFNYTDGLVESDGEDNFGFTEENLILFIKEHHKQDLKQLHSVLLLSLQALRNNKTATDDITLLSLRIY
ncbi:MAG: serine/threonine protein phosphatase [Sphingobacteriales bacterium]|nr:MAG: serine/threonine protein phosphatase [Sphingobacteriales bacterium]